MWSSLIVRFMEYFSFNYIFLPTRLVETVIEIEHMTYVVCKIYVMNIYKISCHFIQTLFLCQEPTLVISTPKFESIV